MPQFVTFDVLPEHMAEKVHNFQSDSFKVMLTNTAPSLANTVKTDITEISAGNGYTAGGAALTVSSSSQTSGIYKWVLADLVMTAVGGPIGPYRYAVAYNDTPTSPPDPLLGYIDYGSPITLAAGQSTTLDFHPTNGALQIKKP